MIPTEHISRALCPWLACLTLTACDTPAAGPAPSPPQTQARKAALEVPTGERVLLHAVGDRVVEGYLVPPVEYGDAVRTIVLDDSLEAYGVERGALVLDVQLVEDGAVVLHQDHTLSLHSRDGARQIDVGVEAPLSVAAGRVAYVAGNAPMLGLRRAALSGGEPEALAPDIVTAWSPVLSSDGREIVFSGSVDGRSTLLRMDAERNIHVRPSRRVPSASVAPRYSDDRLVFQDEQGVVVYDTERGEVLADYPRAALLPDWRGGEVWLTYQGSTERVKVEVPQ